jgi:hypothetical protein
MIAKIDGNGNVMYASSVSGKIDGILVDHSSNIWVGDYRSTTIEKLSIAWEP